MEQDDRTGLAGLSTFHVLLIAAALTMMVMPFITTFNEFLTAVVIKLKLEPILVDWIVPSITRMVAVMLRPLGVQAAVGQDHIYLSGAGRFAQVYLSWNCIGWQSIILFVVTLITGMQGPYTWASKLQCLLLGAVGTFMMNLVRIVFVAVVAFYFGRGPAVLFHDYAGTLMIIVWLLTFWFCAYTLILEPEEGDEGNEGIVEIDPKPMARPLAASGGR